MFHIVHFNSECVKKKMVVPSIWLSMNEDLCLLPPSITLATVAEMESLAKSRVEPEVGWCKHEVISLDTFDTFAEAKEVLENAKKSSTTRELEVDHKRQKRRPAHLDEYATSDNDEGNETDDAEMTRMLTDALIGSSSGNLDPLIVKVEPLPSSSKRRKELKLSEFVPFMAEEGIPSTSRHSEDNVAGYPANRSTTDPVTCTCSSARHSPIFQALRRVRQKMKTHTRILRQLLDGQTLPDVGVTSRGLPTDFPVTLPAKHIKDIEDIEIYLQDDLNFAQTLPYFSELGGNDAKQTLKRIMVKMLHIDLAEQLNWKGRGNKKPFSEYTMIHSLAFNAVKNNPKVGLTTLAEIERYIKDWLRFAPDKRHKKPREEKVLKF